MHSHIFTFKSVEFYEISAEEAGQRIDNFLISKAKNVPKAHLYRLIRKGEVRVNKKRIKADYKLRAADLVRLPPIKEALKVSHEPRKLNVTPEILFENEEFMVINKPSGIAVHGGSGLKSGLIETLRALNPTLTHLELAHRLDRETSGVLVCAKKRQALRLIHQALREKNVTKRYYALLSGRWKSKKRQRVVEVPLKKNQTISGERMVRAHPEGDASKTTFRLVKNYFNCCLVEVLPETGRTHQIRVHAKHIEHAILGDEKYGSKELNKRFKQVGLNRLFLHATSLSFTYSGQTLRFSANLPEELERVIAKLGQGS